MLVALGWLAVGLYICAQAYVSFVVRFRGAVFYGLNVGGAVALAVASAAIQSWQAVAVNVFWAAVSLLALRSGPWPTALQVQPRLVFWPIAALLTAGLVAVTGDARPLGMELLGWAGTLLYAGIYLLFAAGRMGRRRYLLLNVAASALLMPVYYLDDNIPSLVLNVFWAGISLAGVFAVTVIGKPRGAGTVPGEPPLPPVGEAAASARGDAARAAVHEPRQRR